MRRLLPLLIILLTTGITVYSQKIKKVSATYTYYAPETMSVEEAKRTALERAKIQAIADEFGTIVSQSTSTVITNQNGESDTHFFSLGGSDVKGEWIETIGEPKYDIKFEDHLLVVTCIVTGNARKMESSPIDVIAKPLRNGMSLKFESTEFREGDDLYLYFRSPVDGFLAVYIVDEQERQVFCALPYRNSKEVMYPITADTEYIFFSKKFADPKSRNYIDEYVMTANNDRDFNSMYCIFSANNSSKPNMTNVDNTKLPKMLSATEFQKWLAKLMKLDKEVAVNKTTIVISK